MCLSKLLSTNFQGCLHKLSVSRRRKENKGTVLLGITLFTLP